MKKKPNVRYLALGAILILVWLTQWIPALATIYSQTIYPFISYVLSFFSNLFPFAIGDLFIFLSIAGVIIYPIYARLRKKLPWKKVLLRDGEYLLWIYVWFYLAWGLNYSQKNFYQRTEIPYTAYTPENFQEFVDDYITQLNRSYTPVNSINQDLIREETVRIYNQLSDSLGVHRPPHDHPRVKTMLFTPFISMVGVTGSMGPFFCEFTLNGDLLPANYPATYAHELAHLWYHQRSGSQFLCLSGLYPFTGNGYPFLRIFLCTGACTGECKKITFRRRICKTLSTHPTGNY